MGKAWLLAPSERGLSLSKNLFVGAGALDGPF